MAEVEKKSMKEHNQELLERDEVISEEQDMELQVKFLHNIQCINNIIICSIKSIVKSQHVTILR